ncbi:MAG: hypothetical protein IJW15_01990 [Clostridia bacterium]|nr:hypothetical protein [Clostridia bacterium]
MATVNEKMTAIADAIRKWTGEKEPLTLDDMVADVENVYSKGVNNGYHSGQQAGYANGKKAQYDEFWDNYQDNGERGIYMYAFAGGGWSKDTFKPKYKVVPTTANRAKGMFYLFGQGGTEVLDYRTIADMVDLSKITQAQDIFANARMNYIEVDLSNCTSLNGTFRNDSITGYLPTHITLKVSEKCTDYGNCFLNMTGLNHLFFMEGSVISTAIGTLAKAPLVLESAQSVINALKDYSGTTTTRTLTLHAEAKARLSDSDIAIATQKGWTVA